MPPENPAGEVRALRRRSLRRGPDSFSEGFSLAGSILTMERALHNAMQAAGRPLAEVWCMSSLNAAQAIGISASKGSLEAGKDADLVLLDPDFQVSMTIVEGKIACQNL